MENLKIFKKLSKLKGDLSVAQLEADYRSKSKRLKNESQLRSYRMQMAAQMLVPLPISTSKPSKNAKTSRSATKQIYKTARRKRSTEDMNNNIVDPVVPAR